MIDYSPFWVTLKKSELDWYLLVKDHHISSSTLSRLKNGKDVSMKTINDLCRILKCSIPDICVYVESKDDQKL